VVTYLSGEAYALAATGPVAIDKALDVTCPPDNAKAIPVLRTALLSLRGLASSCHLDAASATTTATTSIGAVTLLGVITVSAIDST